MILIVAASLLFGYAILIGYYRYLWNSVPIFTPPKDFNPETSVSIIIPERNEAVNITRCLSAVMQQHYPRHLLEVLVIDDHSDDDTVAIVQRIAGTTFPLRLLRNSSQGKKAAIKTGI